MAGLRTILSVTALLAGAVVSAPAASAVSAAPPAARVRLGMVTLHRCHLGVPRTSYCGSIRVPLDYTDPSAGRIRVGFGWLPTPGVRRTLVAEEGGPGYPASDSAVDYVDSFGSLLQRRNLLLVDARGTGRSALIDCEPLQSLPTPSPRFVRALTACGRQLNHTYRDASGRWVHASDLFTTANAARDMNRVLRALRRGRVDLYGDSYGTYFSQSFLSRYPHRLRSVVLDSAYEARDLDPWYRTTVSTARRAFDRVCRLALSCPRGSAWRRIGKLAGLLRVHELRGRVVGTDARRHRVTVGVPQLVGIINDAGYDIDPYRQLDAAVRAYLTHRDATPLLRLYAQDVGYDYSDYHADPAYFSDGLYFAVACTDYPQLYDMRATKAVRKRQLQRSIRALPADTFAPFSTREWLSVLPYTETYTGCLHWPKVTHPADPPVPHGVSMDAAHVPVLILNGALDSLTPAAGGAHITRQIGSDAQHVVVANEVHLTIEDSPYPCGQHLMQQFVLRPRGKLDTSCARRVPAVRAVPRFPSGVRFALPAHGRAPLGERRLAAVALGAVGDAVHRFDYVDGNRDLGMRGGTIRYRHGVATLHADRFAGGSRIGGRVVTRGDRVRAVLAVVGPAGRARRVVVRYGTGRYATITIDGHRLTAPAP